MYLTEIAPLTIRGAMGVLCPLGITVGVLVAQILGLRSVLGKCLKILFILTSILNLLYFSIVWLYFVFLYFARRTAVSEHYNILKEIPLEIAIPITT
jgi:hypothetical protein